MYATLINVSAMSLVAVAAVHQFGWLNGLAVAAFTWLVTPYAPKR